LELIHRGYVAFFANFQTQADAAPMSAAAPCQEQNPGRQHPRHSDPAWDMEAGMGDAEYTRQQYNRCRTEAGDHTTRAPFTCQFFGRFSNPHNQQRDNQQRVAFSESYYATLETHVCEGLHGLISRASPYNKPIARRQPDARYDF